MQLTIKLLSKKRMWRKKMAKQVCQLLAGEPIPAIAYLHIFFLFFAVLGFELRASTLSHCTTPFFVKGFFKIGSFELFAEPLSGYLHILIPSHTA
jgi:hypothetical protein